MGDASCQFAIKCRLSPLKRFPLRSNDQGLRQSADRDGDNAAVYRCCQAAGISTRPQFHRDYPCRYLCPLYRRRFLRRRAQKCFPALPQHQMSRHFS